MKKLTLILSIVLTVALMAGVGMGYKFLSDAQPEILEPDDVVKHEIIVDDEIKVYIGQKNYISPYLISNDGTVETARFDYASSCDSISVGFDGLITIQAIPDEDVYVNISERNTGTSKRIKLNIIQSLESVLGLIAPDGDLIQGPQKLVVGNTYALSVITEPNGLSIENYCTVTTTDSSGALKEVFNISYDGDKVLLTVVGIGKGKISIRVVNDNNDEIHYSNIEFESSMTDETLANKILQQSGKTLLSKGDLEQIDSIVIDNSITDLGSLKALPNLSTVFIEGTDVLKFEDKQDTYWYRVPETLFYEYYSNEEWSGYQSKLLPFDDDLSGLYVVYHSEKATEVLFEKIHIGYELNKYETTGYENTSWRDLEGNVITNQDVQSVTRNGIHVYAVWEPIEYNIVYHIRDFSITATDTWNYETNQTMRNMASFDETIERTGYRFSGWTDNSGASIFSSNVKYEAGESYTQLTDIQGKTIHLYDLWEPIEYTIVFDTPEDSAAIADMTVSYSKAYTLPVASRPGYKFVSWKTETGDLLLSGMNDKNLSTVDNAEVVLTPVFDQIQYKIVFDLDGGLAPLDENMVTGAEVTLNYTQQYTLPTLTKNGYTGYSWVCSTNGKTYSSTETVYKEFTTECTVTFKAVWTAAVYTINYDCVGGSYEDQETLTSGRFWNDGSSLITPAREGYTFIGWFDEEREFTYSPEGTEWSDNLIHSTDESGSTFNLKAQWSPNSYIVTLGPDGGSVTPNTISVVFDSTYGTLPTPSKTGYTFVGWYLSETKINNTTKVTTASDHTLTAHWSANQYTVSFDSAGGSSCSSITVTYGSTYGSLPTPSHDNVSGSGGYTTYSFAGWYLNGVAVSNGTTVSTPVDHTLTASWNSSWVSTSSGGGGGCLVEGTLITLADGTKKPVEELKMDEEIIVFNHETGQYQVGKIWFIVHGELPRENREILRLAFSDGTEIEIAHEHALFDATLAKYVYLSPSNAEAYVGHEFLNFANNNGDFLVGKVTLVDVEVAMKSVKVYSPISELHLNVIANDMITATTSLFNLNEMINAYAYDGNGKYIAEERISDIQRYGEYSYEEFSEFFSENEYNASPLRYLKVAVGKGLITREDIEALIVACVSLGYMEAP